MRKNYLFPTTFRKIGWCLFVPFAITSFICIFDGSNEGLVEGKRVVSNSLGYYQEFFIRRVEYDRAYGFTLVHSFLKRKGRR